MEAFEDKSQRRKNLLTAPSSPSSQEVVYGDRKEGEVLSYFVEYTDAESVMNIFECSMAPDSPYDDQKLNKKPTKTGWKFFHFQPKEVTESDGSFDDASPRLTTGKLERSLDYVNHKIRNVVQREAGLRSYVEQIFFSPLSKLGEGGQVDYTAEYRIDEADNGAREVNPQESEAGREKADYMLEFRNGAKCPFELKSKKSMKGKQAFENAPVQLLKLDKEPASNCRCIGQIYKHMVKTGSKHGIVSCYDTTIFLRNIKTEDAYVALEMSKPVGNRSDRPCLHQALAYLGSVVCETDDNFDYVGCKYPSSSTNSSHEKTISSPPVRP